MLKSYAAGDFYVDDTCKPVVHLQITQFNPLKTDNIDDILDLLWYAAKVIETYGAYILSSEIIEMQALNSIPVLEAGENSCFRKGTQSWVF